MYTYTRWDRIYVLDKIKFIEKYHIDEVYKRSGLDWEELQKIYNAHSENDDILSEVSENIVKYIKKEMNFTVHSIQSRVKAPEHLIEKIIRKRGIEQNHKYKGINKDNYSEIIRDLVGVRILTLSKEEWTVVHDWIINKFPLTCDSDIYMAETPQAYTRYGDRDIFENKIHKEHSNKGYRSQHYVVNFKGHYCEIQVRTLAEEVYGEFDHKVKYPYRNSNRFLIRYTNMVSQFLDSVDEMISTCFQMKELGWEQCEEYYKEDMYIDWKVLSQQVSNAVSEKHVAKKVGKTEEKIDMRALANNILLRKEG